MGFLDSFLGIFGGGSPSGGGNQGSVEAYPNMPIWQENLGMNLSDFVQNYLRYYQPGKPYSGFTPDYEKTPYESKGLDILKGFLGGKGTGDLFSASKGHVLDTLSGKFADPSTSPFIKAMNTYTNQQTEEAIDQSRARAGARGSYFNSRALGEEYDLRNKAQNYKDYVLGSFLNQERGRQLTASELGGTLDKYENLTVPITKIAASQQYGNLDRLLQEAKFNMLYQDFQRQQKELGGVADLGMDVFGRNIDTVTSTVQPSSTTQQSSIEPWMIFAMEALPLLLAMV